MKPPNDPKDHHWLPKFMMRPWVDKRRDGKAHAFVRLPRKVDSWRKSIKSVGFAEYLYRVEGRGPVNPNMYEQAFGKLEDAAAVVRDKLVKMGPEALSAEEKLSLGAMLVFLLNRRPDIIVPLAAQTQADYEDELMLSLQAAGDWPVDQQTWEQLTLGFGKRIALHTALEVAYSYAAPLIAMPWRLFRFDDQGLKLVLSDRPIVATKRQDEQLIWLSVPLGPNELLVCGTLGGHHEVQYQPEFREALAVQVIGEQFSRCNEFVLAVEEQPYDQLAQRYMTPLSDGGRQSSDGF